MNLADLFFAQRFAINFHMRPAAFKVSMLVKNVFVFLPDTGNMCHDDSSHFTLNQTFFMLHIDNLRKYKMQLYDEKCQRQNTNVKK